MFDLITGNVDRPFREGARGSKPISLTLHGVILGLAVGIPMLRVTHELPPVPSMLAFVAPAPAPPPPPPPAPVRAASVPAPSALKPASGAAPAPVEAPNEVKMEPSAAASET